MKLAQIENGTVVNIIIVDPENIPDWCADWPEADAAKIGDTYADGVFTTPEPVEPVETTEE